MDICSKLYKMLTLYMLYLLNLEMPDLDHVYTNSVIYETRIFA